MISEEVNEFVAIASFNAQLVVDWIIDAMQLAADLFGLLQHNRVET